MRFAKSCGLIRGEWIAIDGAKFRAVASIDTAGERFTLQEYLDSMETADEERQLSIDTSAVQAALEKLKEHPEPEAGFMLMGKNTLPADNVQAAVDAEHAFVVANAVVLDPADNRCLQPMAEAAKEVLSIDNFHVVADAGYSNRERAAHCEAAGILPHVPAMRTVNNQGGAGLFGAKIPATNPIPIHIFAQATRSYCASTSIIKDRYIMYKAAASDCGSCSLKSRCTQAPRRGLARHLYEDALNRMQERVTPEVMRVSRSTVEHPFATIKYRIFGHPRLLMRGLSGARVEIGLASMAYNIKRMTNVLGTASLTEALQRA